MPVILAGDLKTSPWSVDFARIVDPMALRDSRVGIGNHATWPAMMPWLAIPIDHVLFRGDMRVADRFVGPPLGSEHLPVVVDFEFSDAPAL